LHSPVNQTNLTHGTGGWSVAFTFQSFNSISNIDNNKEKKDLVTELISVKKMFLPFYKQQQQQQQHYVTNTKYKKRRRKLIVRRDTYI